MHEIIYMVARHKELYKVPLTRNNPDGEFPALRILDVGCGTGIWAMNVAEYVIFPSPFTAC